MPGTLIRYIELGDSTNLPRWLNVAHFEKFEIGNSNGQTYIAAKRAKYDPDETDEVVFMLPPTPAEHAGAGPIFWLAALLMNGELEVDGTP